MLIIFTTTHHIASIFKPWTHLSESYNLLAYCHMSVIFCCLRRNLTLSMRHCLPGCFFRVLILITSFSSFHSCASSLIRSLGVLFLLVLIFSHYCQSCKVHAQSNLWCPPLEYLIYNTSLTEIRIISRTCIMDQLRIACLDTPLIWYQLYWGGIYWEVPPYFNASRR